MANFDMLCLCSLQATKMMFLKVQISVVMVTILSPSREVPSVTVFPLMLTWSCFSQSPQVAALPRTTFVPKPKFVAPRPPPKVPYQEQLSIQHQVEG